MERRFKRAVNLNIFVNHDLWAAINGCDKISNNNKPTHYIYNLKKSNDSCTNQSEWFRISPTTCFNKNFVRFPVEVVKFNVVERITCRN